MLKLRFKDNNHNAVWLVEPKVTIGTAAESNLTLVGQGIAPNHAEIEVSDNNLVLKNLANGKNIWHNGAPVTETASLAAGDFVRVGSVELQVIDPKQETKSSPTVTRGEASTGWALKANHSALANRVFPIKTSCVIGRSSECDITLAASHLSRRHAKMIIKDGQLYIKDLESSNGTYLNGKRVTEAKVQRGDELRFDTLCFGVIGPANDLDKTSVRTAGQMPRGSISPTPAMGSARVVPKPRRPSVQITEHVSNDDDYPNGSKGIVVAAVIIVAVVAAGFYMGIIPAII